MRACMRVFKCKRVCPPSAQEPTPFLFRPGEAGGSVCGWRTIGGAAGSVEALEAVLGDIEAHLPSPKDTTVVIGGYPTFIAGVCVCT